MGRESGKSSQKERHNVWFPVDLNDRLQQFCREHVRAPAAVIRAAVALLLDEDHETIEQRVKDVHRKGLIKMERTPAEDIAQRVVERERSGIQNARRKKQKP